MTTIIIITIPPPPPPPDEEKLLSNDPDGFAQGKSHTCYQTEYTVARDLIDEAARQGARVRIIYEGDR